MIIKMETKDAVCESWGDSNGNSGSKTIKEASWRFIDDLKWVETSVLEYDETVAQEDYDEYYLSVYSTVIPETRVLIKAKRKTTGEEIAVVSQRRVYLLTDDGKTIEKLN